MKSTAPSTALAKQWRQQWPLDRFKPYPRNARTHPPAQITMLAAMLKRHGPDQPIVVDEGGVILKGHGRLLAAIEAGLKSFPVVIRTGLSDSDKRAMRMEDNQVALLSGWDATLVQGEISSLKLAGYDMLLLGFPEAQLRGWGIAVGTDSAQDPELAPERPKKPTTRKCDVWLIGDHRLVCGDCTNPKDVETSLVGAKPNLMVTDPPYGVNYDADWRNRADRANGKPYGARAIRPVLNDHQSDWTEAWKLFPGNVAYCWHADRHASSTQRSLESVGFVMRSQIIWAKTRLIIGRGDYHVQHEPCWYVVRKGARGNWQGGRSQTTRWDISHQKSETGHSTQKPIECMKRPIENNSRKGDFVYDPFLGSGTTLIAAEMTGRKCLGLEIDPGYCDVVCQRWQTFTGRKATLEASGKTFAETATARARGRPEGRKEKIDETRRGREPLRRKPKPAVVDARPPAAVG